MKKKMSDEEGLTLAEQMALAENAALVSRYAAMIEEQNRQILPLQQEHQRLSTQLEQLKATVEEEKRQLQTTVRPPTGKEILLWIALCCLSLWTNFNDAFWISLLRWYLGWLLRWHSQEVTSGLALLAFATQPTEPLLGMILVFHAFTIMINNKGLRL
jgi:hypothetical protein